MEEQTKNKKILSLIKIIVAIISIIFFTILIYQYITIAKLSNKNNSLKLELTNLTEQSESLTNKKDNISDNYEQYVTDYSRDNYDYVEDDEILVNKD